MEISTLDILMTTVKHGNMFPFCSSGFESQSAAELFLSFSFGRTLVKTCENVRPRGREKRERERERERKREWEKERDLTLISLICLLRQVLTRTMRWARIVPPSTPQTTSTSVNALELQNSATPRRRALSSSEETLNVGLEINRVRIIGPHRFVS